MCQIAPSGYHWARRIAFIPAFPRAGSEFERDLLRDLRRRDRFGEGQFAWPPQRLEIVGRAVTERVDGGHGFPRTPTEMVGIDSGGSVLGSPW